MRGGAGALPRLMPGSGCRGEGPGKTLHTELVANHLAATAALTSTLVPSTVPVTVAFLPAC